MYLRIQATVREAFQKYLADTYGASPKIVIEQPPKPEFGEFALPFSFELAKALRRAPRKIAEEVVQNMPPIPGVTRLEPAGGGYVNVFLDRRAAAAAAIAGETDAPSPATGKVVVEHTNINPNKAAHIGHLRNAALGDSFVRILRARGRTVEVQNYIDNTGVQVGDVVVGFMHLENKTPADVEKLIADPAVRFDYYCWDLYARVSKFFQEDKTRLELRGKTLQQIEHGEGDAAKIGVLVSEAVVHAHLKTMERMDVEYDLLPRESEILHLHFWETAFELLKSRKAIYLEAEGKNKDCWVMPADSSGEQGEDTEADEGKIIVRSNGTVTYVGKDIAYQLWKFGLLGRDFRYRPFFSYADGRTVWVSGTEGDEKPFGRAAEVFNVIDSRQSYLQNIVVAGLRALGYNEQADKSVHFSYEMVALSQRCARELGIEIPPEDQKRPYVEVSGRKGQGVKADDFLDTLFKRALAEVEARHYTPEEAEDNQSPVRTIGVWSAAASRPILDDTQQREIARKIAVGALRFFLLKFTRNAVIAFDFQDALNFDGETGPYVQYAAVRAANIQRKLGEAGWSQLLQELPQEEKAHIVEYRSRFGLPVGSPSVSPATAARILSAREGDDFWQLLILASQADAAAEQALSTSEPAVLAKYTFQLAQAFNTFYHRHHILSEEDAAKKLFLLWLADYVRRQLTRALAWLGMDVPEVM